MKIISIHIYGYGKFKNLIIQDLKDRHVFYGRNEAGKSTIMSFIHSILFGFPSKQQSELKYEPKKLVKYGGMLEVWFPEKGRALIERVKAKGLSEVTVTLESGVRGGEELLNELLQNMDKPLYQAIFSFNLQGLQNVHQLKGEDLGRYLFSTGTIGSDRLFKIENDIQKQLDFQFKPSGRKPVINEKLKDLRQLYKDLKKAEQLNEQYVIFLENRKACQNEIEELNSELKKSHQSLNKLEEWGRMQPVFLEQQVLSERIKEFEQGSFPTDGILRLERLIEAIQPLESQINHLAHKKMQIEQEMESLKPDQKLLDHESSISLTIEKMSNYDQLVQENIQLDMKIKKQKEDLILLKDKLHLDLSDKAILDSNTSIFMNEQTANAQKNQRRLLEKKDGLEERFNEEKRALEEIEMKIKWIKKGLLSETERGILLNKLKDQTDRPLLSTKRDDIQSKIRILKQAKQTELKKRKQDRLQLLMFGVIFFIFTIWGFIEKQLIMNVVGAVGIFICLFFLFRLQHSKQLKMVEMELEDLQKQGNRLSTQLEDAPLETENLQALQLEKDQLQRQELNQLTMKWEQQNKYYEKVIDGFERWEKEFNEHKKRVIELGRYLNLPDEISLLNIHDAYTIVEKMKSILKELEYFTKQHQQINLELEQINTDINHYARSFLETPLSSLSETVLLLKTKLRSEMEKKIQFKEKSNKYSELHEEMNRLDHKMKLLQNDKEKLLQAAHVETEDDFREMGRKAAKKMEIKERMEQLQMQLALSSLSMNEMLHYSNTTSLIKETMEEIQVQIEQTQQKMTDVQNRLAELNYQIGLIEDGGIYTDLLHQYKQRKFDFEEEVKKWSRLALAKDLLMKTIERYKHIQLPAMLTKAEEYLSYLTEGRYIHIFPKEEGSGFLIESHEHEIYNANELSQATTEQLYVSLRLSLAFTIYQKYKLPIIIDDSFVNFDERRTGRVMTLLKTFRDHQLLFFTCHRPLLSYFKQSEMTDIAEKVKLQSV
ncbi:AAA family ATPase [Bacillus sp. 03113]|uniref:ATP-binding protein n=1 Tax=Bacillus sp. 03113 TaxID=2578211 RepID=UPI0015E8882F|nr:AAA family ATPase [Bacillus sp. 03113]